MGLLPAADLVGVPYAIQESTDCTPVLLILYRELQTLAELLFGRLPDTAEDIPGLEYTKHLQDRLYNAHCFACSQLQAAGICRKRYYDI